MVKGIVTLPITLHTLSLMTYAPFSRRVEGFTHLKAYGYKLDYMYMTERRMSFFQLSYPYFEPPPHEPSTLNPKP